MIPMLKHCVMHTGGGETLQDIWKQYMLKSGVRPSTEGGVGLDVPFVHRKYHNLHMYSEHKTMPSMLLLPTVLVQATSVDTY